MKIQKKKIVWIENMKKWKQYAVLRQSHRSLKIMRAELSGDVVKSKDRLPEPKATL